jgi:hypothetical protein
MGKWESGNYIASIIHTYIVKKLDHMRIRPSVLKPSITLCLAHTSLCVQLILSRLFRPSNTVFSLLITVCSASHLQCVLAQPYSVFTDTSLCVQPTLYTVFRLSITVFSAYHSQFI